VWIGTEALKTGLPPKGELVFEPGGAGSVLADGALRRKFLWMHQARGRLQISGRRLDGDAPPLQSVVPEGFEAQDIQPTSLIFPTTGCWEVTGRIGEHRVTFVLRVVKIGDGPARVPEV